MSEKHTTDFGYQEVPIQDKSKLVADVFHSVAGKYDLMNDCMSFGLHRLWKKFTLAEAGVRAGQSVLDVAAGTGDLAQAFAKIVGKKGQVVMTDINATMLQVGQDKLTDAGIIGNISYVQADAEHLPFAENYFDCATIAFGLRNVTHKEAALRSLYRTLKPGGKLLILEFAQPHSSLLSKLYNLYSFHIIPHMGQLITQDKNSYQYLVESIRKHPNQEKLKSLMEQNGFEDVEYFNLTGGIVALHKGYKY